jgi:hypothetical protein
MRQGASAIVVYTKQKAVSQPATTHPLPNIINPQNAIGTPPTSDVNAQKNSPMSYHPIRKKGEI